MTDSLLDLKLPLRTAGALPSSRTEDMLHEALASDNIDEVKAQLAHVWSHYQSLEFAINAISNDAEAVARGIAEEDLEHFDPIAVTLRFVAGPLLDEAYHASHVALDYATAPGRTVPDSLRIIYSTVDTSDPERELNDDDLAAFFAIIDTEETDK